MEEEEKLDKLQRKCVYLCKCQAPAEDEEYCKDPESMVLGEKDEELEDTVMPTQEC